MKNIQLILFLLAAMWFPTSAQAQVILKSDTIAVECNAPDTFLVPLRVRNFDNVGAMQFTLSWNPAFLDYIYTGPINPLFLSGNSNVGFDTTTFINQGKLTFTWTSFGGASVPDDTTLFPVAFTRIGGPFAPVEFTNVPVVVEVTDPIGNEIPWMTMSGGVLPLDSIPPGITCPDDVTLGAPSPSPVFDIDPLGFTDNCDVVNVGYTISGATNLSAPNDPDASGTVFNFGQSIVTYTATDAGGFTASCSFSVTLENTGGGDLTVVAENVTASCGSSVAIDITTFNFDSIGALQFSLGWLPANLQFDSVGNFNPDLQLSSANFGTSSTGDGFLAFSWTTFGLNGVTLGSGATMFTIYLSLNGSAGSPVNFGNFPTPPEAFSSATQPPVEIPLLQINGSVMVNDTVAPVLDCPDNITVNAGTGSTTAQVTGLDPGLSDDCGGNVALSYATTGATTMQGQGPANGTYNAGTTTVTYTAVDGAGNSSTCSFTVTVDAGQVLTLLLDSVAVDCQGSGQQISVNISVENFSDVWGLQFSVEWDETVLQFVSVSNEFPGLGLTPSNFLGFTSTPMGLLRFLGGNAVTGWPAIPNGGTFFTINFTVLDATASTTINFIPPFDAVNGSFNSVPLLTVNGNFQSQDLVPPFFTSCPQDTVVSAVGNECNVNFTLPLAAADDACSSVQSLVSNQADDIFDAGATLVIYTATDEAGNTSTCTFTVSVLDITPPSLQNCPDTVFYATTDSSCLAFPDWAAPLGVDPCGSGNLTLSATFAPGDTFQLGVTEVVYTVTDFSGNTGTCSFVVVVEDMTGPVLVCPPNDTISAIDSLNCSGIANFNLPAGTDNCDLDLTYFSTISSGDTLPVGLTTVVFTGQDDAGNTGICNFSIIVIDANPPVLGCPADLTVNSIPDSCGAYPNWMLPMVTDDCTAGNIIPTSTFDPGVDFFPVGTTTVIYFASDAFNNVGTCQFSISVFEDVPPTFTGCPGPIIVNLPPGVCDTVVNWIAPQAADNCSLDSVFANAIPGSSFTTGTDTIVYTAVDASGNSTTCTFTVAVLDQIAPQFTSCPQDTVIDGAGACGIVLDWTIPGATDNCDPDPGIFASHMPSDTFFGGETTVVIFAQDASGNYDTCSFKVTVNAVTMIGFANAPADINLAGCSAVATWTAPDPVGFCLPPVVTSNYMPGDTFPAGSTVVTYTATDQSGLSTTITFTVSVTETAPPTISCPPGIMVNTGAVILSDPGDFISTINTVAGCDSVALGFSLPVAADNCDNVQVTQISGPLSGEVFPAGLQTLVFQATDASGNTASCSMTVEVLSLQALVASASPNPGCEGDIVTLTVDDIPGAVYTWTGPQQMYPNTSQITIINLSAGNVGLYTVQAEINGCSSNVDSVNVEMAIAPMAEDDEASVLIGEMLDSFNLLSNDIFFPVNDINVTLLSPLPSGLEDLGNGVIAYTPAAGSSGRQVFQYSICSSACPTLCDIATVTITVQDSDCSFIPNIFTPNEDGQNDYFVIPCLDSGLYPENSVVIYNQWGDQVFTAEPYDNAAISAWRGTLNNEGGKDLPDGVYFYIFKSAPDAPPVKGFVEIYR